MSSSQERPADHRREDERAGEGGGLDLLGALEAMLFVSPEPLGVEEIEGALDGTPAEEIRRGLDALAGALKEKGRGLRLEAVAGGYRLVTRPELAGPLQALFRFRNRKRLTPATLDVLAIVSYAQPITAPEIQQIRGTDPAYALRVLQERRLVRMAGRKRVVGRPILYATTKEFLVHFGLDSLDDLPPVEAYGTQVVPAQGRLFSAAEPGAELVWDDDAEPDGGLPSGEEGEPSPEPEAADGAAGDEDGESSPEPEVADGAAGDEGGEPSPELEDADTAAGDEAEEGPTGSGGDPRPGDSAPRTLAARPPVED